MGRKQQEDLIGKKYGMLTVIDKGGSDIRGRPKWLCQCECGGTKIINSSNVKRQYSCGCVRVGGRTHGVSKHPLYFVWKGMHQRCYNQHEKAYKHYGGRGIKVCDRWHDVRNFIEDMSPRPTDYTIERIDVNGDYAPDNCKWIPLPEQSLNKRNSIKVDGVGTAELALRYGLPKNTVMRRVKIGKSLDDPHCAPVIMTFEGLTLNQREWAKRIGISECTISWRRRQGWPISEVLRSKHDTTRTS